MIGILQTLDCPEIAEILSMSGFDWLFVDMEHSALNVQSVQRILQTIDGKCTGIVRVPSHDEMWTKQLLDAGARGIIFPQVNSAREAADIIRGCKYPPEGSRGVGISRAQGYGLKFQDYVDTANREIAVILQIEHIDGVRNIDSIVKVPGIDAIFVGPYDLSCSMNKIGRVNDPEVQQQIETVRRACVDAGLTLGIFTANPREVKVFIEKGYRLIAVGIDIMLLGQSARQVLEMCESGESHEK
jgi:2-dehydro-3-deoxyglucarate aldolase/4-hydroxy-2-oxoheptanedioate aldolase